MGLNFQWNFSNQPEVRDEEDGGQRPSGEEDDDGGADGLGEECGHVGSREEVLEDQGEGELALGRFGFGGRGLDAAQHVASAKIDEIVLLT